MPLEIHPLPDVMCARTLDGWKPSEWQSSAETPPRDGPYQRQLGRQMVVSWYRWGAWYTSDVRDVRSPNQDASWRGLVSGRVRS